jgi:Glycosyltransferase sugar-binding region containing DXD motif
VDPYDRPPMVREDTSRRLPIVQSFWHGDVSTMERLSAASFAAHGHELHVYAFGDLRGLPPSAVVRDAAEITPPRRRRAAVYRDSRGSFSSFANMFRYKLILERGGWWVDLDTICLRPFDLPQEHVFATEPDGTIANGTFRASAGSPVMEYAYEECRSLGRRRRKWGTTGPRLLAEAVKACGLERYAVPAEIFIPVAWPDWMSFLDPSRVWSFGPETRAVHLFNGLWAKEGRSKDARYDPHCLYELLKKRYLGEASPGAS